MVAEAFCVSQTFAAAPRRQFTTDRHYLLYATSGSMRLEADGKMWALPPARAALIAAGQPVQVTLTTTVIACSALFDVSFMPAPDAALTVFDMSPLARELILHCGSWTDRDTPLDPYGRQIFLALAGVAGRLAATPSRAVMPAPGSRGLARAMALTEQRVSGPLDFEAIAAEVGMTPRTLARRFASEMGMTWRQALRRLRMIRALELLTDESSSITAIAFAVGYGSLSAFNAAFFDFVGETPTAYRKRFRGAATPAGRQIG